MANRDNGCHENENKNENKIENEFEIEDENEFDVCDSICLKMANYKERVLSFKQKNWKTSLQKSANCSAEKMAVMWYCLGPSLTRCFACFKELEGWEESDNPEKEHEKHCPNCPLIKLGVISKGLKNLSVREKIRLEIGIEFERKRVLTRRQWAKTNTAFEATRQSLQRKLNEKRADCKYQFHDENEQINPWRHQL